MNNPNPSVISGITPEYAERLHEEGILNIQNLAHCDPDMVSKRTMLNKETVFDWKDEAILRLLTENIQTARFHNKNATATQTSPAEKQDSTTEQAKEGTADNQNLYCVLQSVGISNISTLAKRLGSNKTENANAANEPADLEEAKQLVRLLGWAEKEEHYNLLLSTSIQGLEMLGTAQKASVTAFAFDWTELK